MIADPSKATHESSERDPYKICARCGCRNYRVGIRCGQCHASYFVIPPLFPIAFVTALIALVVSVFVVR
jgi:hypothetical protein